MQRRKKHSSPIMGLDIGTTKVSIVVGDLNEKNKIEIVGIGSHASSGLKRGVVVNIEATVDSIQKAAEEAERMSGYPIKEVMIAIGGDHIKGMKGHGMVTLRDKEVTSRDIERVIESANTLLIPTERETIHSIAQDYTVDRESGINDPIGIHGLKLEANVHIVTGDVTSRRNIEKCIKMSGMTSAGIVLKQIASSEAVLTRDEKEIGVAMIDFGGGTCSIAIFMNGSVQYTENISLGGDNIDRDIAFGLSISLPKAKKLKEDHGVALAKADEMLSDETIEIRNASDSTCKKVLKRDLIKIIELRMEEIFILIKEELSKAGFIGMLPAGVVLTGGSSKMKETKALAEQVLEMPTRVGVPYDVHGLTDIVNDPVHSTGIGLVKYAIMSKGLPLEAGAMNKKNVFTRMKSWFSELF